MTAAGSADATRTLELDSWLDRPEVRITRGLRGLSWVTASELFKALELEPASLAEYEGALAHLVKTGHVSRRNIDGGVRYELFLELDAPRPGESLRPLGPGIQEGEQRGAWFWWRGCWRPM